MSSNESLYPQSGKNLSVISLVVGILGLLLSAYGLYRGLGSNDTRPVLSWLIGFSIWFSIGIGMLFLVMLFHLFDAGWPIVIRRQLEHALAGFPWLALIFLPLLAIGWFSQNPGILWKWMNPNAILPGGETVAEDVLYLSKESFLNLKFFTVRVVIYFTIFCGLSFLLRNASFGLDKTGDPSKVKRMRAISAVGIILVALSATFSAFDFFMSLSYHWFSTMYGVWFFATSMRAALAMIVIICLFLSQKGHLKGFYNRGHRYNLGCLCLAFTVFWAYIAFCQYFLIYNANIPEETFWFNLRELTAGDAKNSWWWVSLLGLVLGYFVIPFLYLLWYSNKVVEKKLVFICLWILFFHIIDIYFNILPGKVASSDVALGFVTREFSVTLWDVTAFLGVGGICLWAFLGSMRKAPGIPIRDPRIEESIHYHE